MDLLGYAGLEGRMGWAPRKPIAILQGSLEHPGPVQPIAPLAASPTLSAFGVSDVEGSAGLSAIGELSAYGASEIEGVAVFAARGVLGAYGDPSVEGAARLDGRGALSAWGCAEVRGRADLAAVGVLSAVPAVEYDPASATIEAALRAHLLDDPAIAALVGDRIFTLIAPPDTSSPLITLYVTYEKADQILVGLTNRREASVTLTGWALDTDHTSGYTQARQLGEALRDRLVGAAYRYRRIRVEGIEELGLHIPPPTPDGITQVSLDVSVFYSRR